MTWYRTIFQANSPHTTPVNLNFGDKKNVRIVDRLIGWMRVTVFSLWLIWISAILAVPLIFTPWGGSTPTKRWQANLRGFIKQYWCRSQNLMLQWLGLLPDIVVYVSKKGDPARNRAFLGSWIGSQGNGERSKDDNLVVIANHQLYWDWMILWCVFDAINWAKDIFIVLRGDLKAIPILGWAMERFGFIFVKRTWNDDEESFIGNLQLMRRDPRPAALLIFPEGTVFCQNTYEKMLLHASGTMREDFIPKNTLLPRARGTFKAIQTLQGESFSGILNLTVGYEGARNGIELFESFKVLDVLLSGSRLGTIHLLVNIIPAQEIPFLDDYDGFKDWLVQLFGEKEKIMAGFYENNGQFSSDHGTIVKGPCGITSHLESEVGMKAWRLFCILYASFGIYCFFRVYIGIMVVLLGFLL